MSSSGSGIDLTRDRRCLGEVRHTSKVSDCLMALGLPKAVVLHPEEPSRNTDSPGSTHRDCDFGLGCSPDVRMF